MEMHHFWHKQHSLILNEVYIAKEGDVCLICNEQIVSCKSFVYSCTRATGGTSTDTSNADDRCVKFLLHKSCAELPPTIEDPSDEKQSLSLRWLRELSLRHPDDFLCKVCGIPSRWSAYTSNWSAYTSNWEVFVCLECAVIQLESPEDRKFDHPAHSQHTLLLVPRPSSFRCDACKMESDIKDLSYICTTCPFWLHKSCADAPASFRFPCHNKHPLILSFHLPQVYQKFDQHCKLCRKKLYPSVWIYYCPKCRFFAHFQCARSSHVIRSSETYPDLVHLPAADESSSATNVLVEQFVKAMSTETTSSIKQWADCEHGLQLITYNELNDQKDDDDGKILLCDFCVKPIRADGNQFYGCVSCNYFLHTDCAKLPNKIKHRVWPRLTLSPRKCNIFYCYVCKDPGNGICFEDKDGDMHHIGCALLPEKIKHEAHPHQLDRTVSSYKYCTACGDVYSGTLIITYRCGTCDLDICGRCIMMERTGKHRWDPHPLCLIYEAEMVADHEHEFNCEFCSQEIDTNTWFYHCSHCDLSFHILCFRKLCFPDYSNIKFGVTDIIIDKLHPHGLTFVLNKKCRRCKRWSHGEHLIGEPVLECTPCKVIFCRDCLKSVLKNYY